MSLYTNLIKTEIYKLIKQKIFIKASTKYSDLHEYKDLVILYEKISKENIKPKILNVNLEIYNLKNIKTINNINNIDFLETKLNFKNFKNVLNLENDLKEKCSDCLTDKTCGDCEIYKIKGCVCFLELKVLKTLKKFTLNILFKNKDNEIKTVNILNLLKLYNIEMYKKLYNDLLSENKEICGYIVDVYTKEEEIKKLFDILYFKKIEDISKIKIRIISYYELKEKKYVLKKIKENKNKTEQGLYINFKTNTFAYFIKNYFVVEKKDSLERFLLNKFSKDGPYLKIDKIKHYFDFKDILYSDCLNTHRMIFNDHKALIPYLLYDKNLIEETSFYKTMKSNFHISNYEIFKIEKIENKIKKLIEIDKNNIDWFVFIKDKKIKNDFIKWFLKNLKKCNEKLFKDITKTFKYLSLSELLNNEDINVKNLKYYYDEKYKTFLFKYNELDEFIIDIINIKQIIYNL